MKKSVKVAVHPTTKLVITVNENKPEFGTIRVDQEVISMENGFINRSNRSAFLAGKLEDLKDLGYTAGQALSGKIVRTESLTPMFEGQQPKINPTTNEVVLVNGAKVYFKDEYTENDSKKDSLIVAGVQAEVAVNAGLAD